MCGVSSSGKSLVLIIEPGRPINKYKKREREGIVPGVGELKAWKRERGEESDGKWAWGWLEREKPSQF
jgi:hypothetical protein